MKQAFVNLFDCEAVNIEIVSRWDCYEICVTLIKRANTTMLQTSNREMRSFQQHTSVVVP